MRVQAGFSQRELARRTGLNHQTISKIELGVADPSYSVLSQVAAGIGVSLSDLIIVAEAG